MGNRRNLARIPKNGHFAPGFLPFILLSMQFTLAHIGPRPPSGDPFDTLTRTYLARASTLIRSESAPFKTEDAFLDWLTRQSGRTPALPVLLDSRGRQMSSEDFAAWIGARRDEGIQHVVFAIGPADGWSGPARRRASLLLSLGPLTLAHSLARLVLAEQLYRACTILSGHPYHTGH